MRFLHSDLLVGLLHPLQHVHPMHSGKLYQQQRRNEEKCERILGIKDKPLKSHAYYKPGSDNHDLVLFDFDRLFHNRRLRGGLLLLDADNAGRECVHKEDIATAVAGDRQDGLDRALGRYGAGGKLPKLEDRIVDLPIATATDGAGLTKCVLKMVLKPCTALGIELHR